MEKVTILDKNSLVKQLCEILKKLSQSLPVYTHPAAMSQIIQLLARSGSEKSFLTKLKEFLQILIEHSGDFTNYAGLEKLKGAEGIYSMRFKLPNKNIRVLFSMYEGNLLLLSAFHERQGKKVSEYEAYLPEAEQRLAEMTNRR